jgi:uncharacterized membrane protein
MPFCTQCGHEVSDRDIFCANCGARQIPASYPAPGIQVAPDPLAGLSPRTAAILCYIPTVGWIAAVIVLAARKFRNNHIVRFHAFQGLYLFALWLIVHWVVQPIVAHTDNFLRVDRILSGLLLGVSIFMMVKASHDQAYVLPVIGELAQRSASEP